MDYEALKKLIEDQLGRGFEANPEYNDSFKENGVTLVDSKGGNEGDGEDVSRVYEKDGIFARITGHYSSYDGTEWNDIVTQVFPETRTITFYEPTPEEN